MTEKRLSVGINVSILVILTIFGVLLSLPLRLLFETKYHSNDTVQEDVNQTDHSIEDAGPPIDFRKLMQCPRFEYRERMNSVFRSDYDGNCTYIRESSSSVNESEKLAEVVSDDVEEDVCRVGEEIVVEVVEQNTEPKVRRAKSIPIAGHILGTMLLISAIAAFVEVIRVRFAKDKDSSRRGTGGSRKSSTIDLPLQRRFAPKEPIKSQRSFEMHGMHRSALRLLGARPPPLIRRSSFPTQQAKQAAASSVSGTPNNNRTSRRQSAESDEEIGVLINALHHRTRLIRRH